MNIVIDDVRYHYELFGQNDDIPPLLLLHGFTGDGTTWEPLCKQLEEERQCIVLDIIGHGRTESPEDGKYYNINQVAYHLEQLLNALHIEKIDLLGYSMGGRLALTFAVHYPERVHKLILESASPGLKTEAERSARRLQDEKLAQFILEQGVQAFVQYWEGISLFRTQQSLPSYKKDKIRKQRLQNTATGLANSLLFMGTGTQPSLWSKMDKLPMEVLFITGKLDEKFCKIANKMCEITPKGQNIVVSRCGHAIHVEDCEKFDTIVSEFLSKK